MGEDYDIDRYDVSIWGSIIGVLLTDGYQIIKYLMIDIV